MELKKAKESAGSGDGEAVKVKLGSSKLHVNYINSCINLPQPNFTLNYHNFRFVFLKELQEKLKEAEQERDETVTAYQAVQKTQEDMVEKLTQIQTQFEETKQTNKVLF